MALGDNREDVVGAVPPEAHPGTDPALPSSQSEDGFQAPRPPFVGGGSMTLWLRLRNGKRVWLYKHLTFDEAIEKAAPWKKLVNDLDAQLELLADDLVEVGEDG
jgi:hypothetical protein